MKKIQHLRVGALCILSALFVSCDMVVSKVEGRLAESREVLANQSAPNGIERHNSKSQTENLESNVGDGIDGVEIPARLTGVAEQILVRSGYTVSYNKDRRLPNWVAWHLTPARLKGNAKRGNHSFSEDMDVPQPRAVDFDYVRSGYDRGHMCPAGDNKWDEKAMEESFFLTNVCPQAPSLNRGDWNEMEQACRKWAKQYGDIYIVCGPIFYKKRQKTIGNNKVAVPDAFFKVVLCMGGTPKAIGFIYKNGDGNRPKGDYANSVDEVERITGIDFFPSLPDKIENRVEAQCNLSDWDIE